MVPLSEGGAQQMPLFSPDGQQIAFVRDNNLFLVKLLYDNAESQITKDGKRNEIINGLPDWVYEEEFATNRSFVFTADSKQICWIRYDESKVKEYSFALYKGSNPTEDSYADYPGAYSYKYPIAGEENSQVAVYSFDIKSRQTRKLQVPVEADGYIPRLMMTADATKVAVFTLNRHQDELAIYMANPLSTVAQMVLQEKADKYIRFEAMDGIQITDRHILMPSDRDGYNHLYLYTLGGRLERKITNGNFEVTDVYGYDETTGKTYFASNALGAQEKQVYCAEANGKIVALAGARGTNNAVFSSNYQYFLNRGSDLEHPDV